VAVIDQQPLSIGTEPTINVDEIGVGNQVLNVTVGGAGDAEKAESITLFYGPMFTKSPWFCYPQITQFGHNSASTVPVYSESVILQPALTNRALIKPLSEKAAFAPYGARLDPTGSVTFKADTISAALVKRSFAGMPGSAGPKSSFFNGVGCQQLQPGVTQSQTRAGRWGDAGVVAPLYQETIRIIALPEVVAVEKSAILVHPCTTWNISWPLTWSDLSGDFTSGATIPGQLHNDSDDCHSASGPSAILSSQSWTFQDSDAINSRNAVVSTSAAILAIFVGVLVSFMLTMKPAVRNGRK
jgi:hypothetical protein